MPTVVTPSLPAPASDTLRLVRFVAPHYEAARPQLVADLTTSLRKVADGGSPQLTPGEHELGNVVLDVPYAGEVQTLDRHHNSRLTFVLRTFAADQVVDTDQIVAAILGAPPRSAVEWKRGGAGTPTYFPLRGGADWQSTYSASERYQQVGQLVQVGCEVAPWVHRGSIDIHDDFAADSIADYTFDSGVGSLGVSAGQLAPTSTAEKRLYHSARGYRYEDAQATFKYTVGASTDGYPRLLLRRSATEYITAGVNGAAGLAIARTEAGVATNLNTGAKPASAAAASYWIVCRKEGNLLTVEHWAAAPTPMGAPQATLTHTLAGADATKYGAGATLDVGIWMTATPADWRFDDFRVEAFTYRARTLPATIALGGAVPGDIPALADVEIAHSGGATAPVSALLGWTQRPRAPAAGTAVPFGVIEAETATALTMWAVTADATARGGSKLSATLTSGQAGPAEASFDVDPSTLEPDDDGQTISLEVFARTQRAPTLLAPRLVLVASGGASAGYGSDRHTEHGPAGVAVLVPTATDWRTVRLGRIRLSAGAGTGTYRLKVQGMWTVGSTGLFGLDYLLAVPTRAFASSPSGAVDASYPSFVRSTAETVRTLLAEGGGLISFPAGSAPRNEAGLGRRIELPLGQVDLAVKLATLPVDNQVPGWGSEQLLHTATVHARVLPRYHLV